MNANSLQCAEMNGQQLSLDIWVRENLITNYPISLKDVINVHENGMSCTIRERS